MPSVIEVWDGRSGEVNSRRERNYTKHFLVAVETATMGFELVRLATGVPRPWNSYVSASGAVDLFCFCDSVTGRQKQEDPFLWQVDAHYSNIIPRPDIHAIENPLLRPAEISYDGLPVTVPALYDRNGGVVANSAGVPFDPPLETEEYRLSIVIRRNQLVYDAIGYLKYFNSVNDKPFLGFPKGMVKCAKITGSRQYENGVFHWPTTFEFHVRLNRDLQQEDPNEESWAAKVLDQSWYELSGPNDGTLKAVRDNFTGALATSPRLLDGSGHVLPVGGSPVFRYFDLLRSKDFNALLLV